MHIAFGQSFLISDKVRVDVTGKGHSCPFRNKSPDSFWARFSVLLSKQVRDFNIHIQDAYSAEGRGDPLPLFDIASNIPYIHAIERYSGIILPCRANDNVADMNMGGASDHVIYGVRNIIPR